MCSAIQNPMKATDTTLGGGLILLVSLAAILEPRGRIDILPRKEAQER